MNQDSSRMTLNWTQNSSRMTMNQTLSEELQTDQLRALGLGYNYAALKDQVATILTGAVQKVLPHFDDETRFNVGRTPTGRPRYSVDTNSVMQFDQTLCDLAREKEPAKEAVEKAVKSTEKSQEMACKVELYVLTLNTILAELQAGPDPRIAPPRPVNHLAVPSRSGAKDTTAGRRLTSRPTQGTSFGWKQAANNNISQNCKTKVTKSKGPPPKPLLGPVTEEEFEKVSAVLRENGKVKLADVNQAYDVLYHAFQDENLDKVKFVDLPNRGIQVGSRVQKAKIKVLRNLKRINISADEKTITALQL